MLPSGNAAAMADCVVARNHAVLSIPASVFSRLRGSHFRHNTEGRSMNRMRSMLACVPVALCSVTARADVILYVNAANTTGANNGSSWPNAFQGTLGLQSALAAAAVIATPANPVQVWTAAGTYLPTSDPNSADTSFQLHNSVAVYGGFAGTETLLTQRNPSAHLTALSGVIVSGFNSFHVVRALGTDATAILDGVTVSGGDCRFGTSNRSGAGILISAGSPIIRGCTVGGGAITGGGIANTGGGSPTISNCTLNGTVLGSQGGQGGALYSNGGLPSVTNCMIQGSTGALGDGGGVYCAGGTTSLTDCTIQNGLAESGGGLSVSGGTLNLLRCIVQNNRTGSGGCGIAGPGSGTCIARDCLISGNHMASAGGPYGGGAVGGIDGAVNNRQ